MHRRHACNLGTGEADRTGALEQELHRLERPVLVVSTVVGRGMFTLGEALVERFDSPDEVTHRPIEDFLPAAAFQEDLKRYKWISNRYPILLNLVYRFHPIYLRKLLRERYLRTTRLDGLGPEIRSRGIRTVLCVSHRPAFWISCLKEREALDLDVVGLSGEYGTNLGWRFIFWRQMNAFLSPIPRRDNRFPIPAHVRFREIELPARQAYGRLAYVPGDPRSVLVVCGFWGQGPIERIVGELLTVEPALTVHAVCGENEVLRKALEASNKGRGNVHCHGEVDSLAPLLEKCASIVTKPGISTLLEAHAAGRKIFLLRGMPVAEDNNLRFAMEHFGAERFTSDRFRVWFRRKNG